MTESPGPHSGPQDMNASAPGRGGLRHFAAGAFANILDYLQIRLTLFSLEVREARSELIRRGLCVAGGLFFGLFAYGCLLTGGIAGLAALFGCEWFVIALIAAFLHLGVAISLLLSATRRFSSPPFRDTLNEFEKDRQWLNDLRPRP
jgi:uncharacterized membrane protein YqjE